MSRRHKDDFVNKEIPQLWLLSGLLVLGVLSSLLFFVLVAQPMYFAGIFGPAPTTPNVAQNNDLVPVAAGIVPQPGILRANISVAAGRCLVAPASQNDLFTLNWQSDVAAMTSASVSTVVGRTMWHKDLDGYPSTGSVQGTQEFAALDKAQLKIEPGITYYAWVDGYVQSGDGTTRGGGRGNAIGDQALPVAARNNPGTGYDKPQITLVKSNIVSFAVPLCPTSTPTVTPTRTPTPTWAPLAAQGLTLECINKTTTGVDVRVTWQDSAYPDLTQLNSTYYNVMRRAYWQTSYTTIASRIPAVLSPDVFIDRGVSYVNSYDYKIKTCKNIDANCTNGVLSNTKVVACLPPVPTSTATPTITPTRTPTVTPTNTPTPTPIPGSWYINVVNYGGGMSINGTLTVRTQCGSVAKTLNITLLMNGSTIFVDNSQAIQGQRCAVVSTSTTGWVAPSGFKVTRFDILPTSQAISSGGTFITVIVPRLERI